MTDTQPISFASIDRSSRLRSIYSGIEDLAQSVLDHGLIQPIVISPKEDGNFLLNAGGRRCAALDFLLVNSKWDGQLYHGITSKPGFVGYVTKDEPGTELSNLLTEIAENLDRQDVAWQDNMKGIVRAAKLLRQQAHSNDHMIVQRDLGSLLGCGYQDLRAAEAVYSDYMAFPSDYAMASTVRNAYSILLKKQEVFAMALYNERAFKPVAIPSINAVQIEPSQVVNGLIEPAMVIDISSNFHCCDWKNLDIAASSIDNIITDPDFGIPADRLMSKAGLQNVGYAAGINQLTPEQSLLEMDDMFVLAFHWLKPSGWFIFFYDLDHHEKLQAMGINHGFCVQRWPMTWHKLDYRSNAAPTYNTCKNVEWAMLCRKPGATLAASPQMSSIFACNSNDTIKKFGHPFAKPPTLWQHLFSLCCIKGQTVLDPCCGRGSMPVAAIDWGLNPIGCEVSPDHHSGLVYNLQTEYRTKYGPNVQFV